MKNDPIIDDLHHIRSEYAAQFDFDLDALFRDLKDKEKKSKWVKVKRSPNILSTSRGPGKAVGTDSLNARN